MRKVLPDNGANLPGFVQLLPSLAKVRRRTALPEKWARAQLSSKTKGPGEIHKGWIKHINFLAPTQNPQFWTPRKKFMCLISWERTEKGDPHKLFRGDFPGQKGGPKRATFDHKKFSLLFFFVPLEKGPPRNHPEKSSQKLAVVECRLPYDSYNRHRRHFWALFRRRILGQYPAAPCSPGPFVLLLNNMTRSSRLQVHTPKVSR